MQVDTGAESRVILRKIWFQLGKTQLNVKRRNLKAYKARQLALLRSLTFDVEWNRTKTKIN